MTQQAGELAVFTPLSMEVTCRIGPVSVIKGHNTNKVLESIKFTNNLVPQTELFHCGYPGGIVI